MADIQSDNFHCKFLNRSLILNAGSQITQGDLPHTKMVPLNSSAAVIRLLGLS